MPDRALAEAPDQSAGRSCAGPEVRGIEVHGGRAARAVGYGAELQRRTEAWGTGRGVSRAGACGPRVREA
ncbi:hypothetical protein GCM10028864_63970 [Microlunatus parietis]